MKSLRNDNMKKIIFVCTGNTCRSPLAESYAKKVYPELKTASRGLMVTSNKISRHTLTMIKKNNLPEPKPPVQLTAEDTLQAKILVMTESHKAMVENIEPQADVELLSFFSVGKSENISDPYGGPETLYNQVFREIQHYIDKMNV